MTQIKHTTGSQRRSLFGLCPSSTRSLHPPSPGDLGHANSRMLCCFPLSWWHFTGHPVEQRQQKTMLEQMWKMCKNRCLGAGRTEQEHRAESGSVVGAPSLPIPPASATPRNKCRETDASPPILPAHHGRASLCDFMWLSFPRPSGLFGAPSPS